MRLRPQNPKKPKDPKKRMTRKFVVIIKKLCQRIVDSEDMPEDWKTSVIFPVFKGKV